MPLRNLYGVAAAGLPEGAIPTSRDMLARAAEIINRNIVPLTLVAVEYDRVTDAGWTVEPSELVVTAALADTVHAWNPTFVLDPELVIARIGGRPATVSRVVITVDGREYPVEVGQRFRLCNPPRVSGTLDYEIRFEINGSERRAWGAVPYRAFPDGAVQPTAAPPPPVECGPLGPEPVGCSQAFCIRQPCWDLKEAQASTPFDAPGSEPGQDWKWGTVSIRVYPATGTVTPIGNDECDVVLRRPIVLVDGFDVKNNRSQQSIYAELGGAIESFRALGLDVITLDWTRGRDFLQRNAYAVQAFLVDTIPQITVPEVVDQNRVIVIGGSMGGEVSRYALRDAELRTPPLDHNTGLFISFDAPHQGANLPISLQAGVDYFAPLLTAASDFQDALNAPATRQLLMRTRTGWNETEMWFNNWYVPHPDHTAYYDEVNAPGFGLPATRNLAIVNGSGTGSVLATPEQYGFDDPRREYPGHDLLRFGWRPLFLRAFLAESWFQKLHLNFQLNVGIDYSPGAPFFGFMGFRVDEIDINVMGIPIKHLSDGLHVYYSQWVPLEAGGQGIDIAAGGTRATPLQIREALAGAVSLPGLPAFDVSDLLHVDQDVHNFMPIASALNLAPGAPAASTPFHASWWEKCNTPHGTLSGAAEGFLVREVQAFAYGLPAPAQPPRYETKCNEPEPRDHCLELVRWYPNPGQPTLRQAEWDTVNCRVESVPTGYVGEAWGQHYYVKGTDLPCPPGTTPADDGTCTLATLPVGVQATLQPLPPVISFSPYSSAPPEQQCPAGTLFGFLGPGGRINCYVILTQGFTPDDLQLCEKPWQPTRVCAFIPISCALGISERVPEVGRRCRIGTAPAGVTPFHLDAKYYYDGAD